MPVPDRFVLVLALSGVLPVQAAASTLDPPQFPPDATVQRILDERVDAGGAVGLVVGLLEMDGTTRVFTAGSAGVGAPPLGPTSVFQIGSISKVLTGTLLADMVPRGEVSLNDPVAGYLPAAFVPTAPASGTITLADLATHRSGLPHVPDDMPMADLSDPYADYTVEALYGFVSHHERDPHGEKRVEYSNVGVGLLGHLLASRLGTSWDEAVRERVLEPLGMDMTATELDTRMLDVLARGHDLGGAEVPAWDFGAMRAAGGLFSTADDLLRFLAANVGEPRTALQHAMRTAHHPRARVDHQTTVGLTWFVRSVGERRTVWHGGVTGGYHSFLGFDPDRGIAVVVLANSGPGVDDLGFHLLNPEAPLEPVALPDHVNRPEVAAHDIDLVRYVGDYFVMPDAPLRIDLADGRLWAKLPGRSPHPAYADGRGGFFLRAVDVELAFEPGMSGDVLTAVIRNGDHVVRARRMDGRLAGREGGR